SLTKLGYVRRFSRRQQPLILCSLFAIARADGSGLRLIYDGRPLNAQCQSPPSLRLAPLSEDLQALLANRAVHGPSPSISRLSSSRFGRQISFGLTSAAPCGAKRTVTS